MAKRRRTKEERKQARKDSLKNPVLILLVPYMRAILKKKGHPKGSSLKETVKIFADKILGLKASYEYKAGMNHLDPVTISVIVSAIVNFFKKLKEKKDKGETLTAQEEEFLKVGDEVAATGGGVIKDAGEEKIGEFFTSPLGIVVSVLALYFIAKAVFK